MNLLRLALAWCFPLWFVETSWAISYPQKIAIERPERTTMKLNGVERQAVLWFVRFGSQHYSKSGSLRTALVSALRKLDKPRRTPAPQPEPQKAK